MNFANQSMSLEIIDKGNSKEALSNKDLYYSQAPIANKNQKKPKKSSSDKEVKR
jgi:hypothetical protein